MSSIGSGSNPSTVDLAPIHPCAVLRCTAMASQGIPGKAPFIREQWVDLCASIGWCLGGEWAM